MVEPTIEQLGAWAADYRRVPVWEWAEQGDLTAAAVFRRLKAESRHAFILESAEGAGERGRYTFLGYKPTLCARCLDGELTIERDGRAERQGGSDPLAALRGILAEHAAPRVPGLPPYIGGLVGYFAFDFIKYIEPTLKLDAADHERLADMDLMLFDTAVVFDHQARQVLYAVHMDAGAANLYGEALERLTALRDLAENGTPAHMEKLTLKSDFQPLFDKAAFCEMVEAGKRHIYEGDVFQVVLSNCMEAEAEGSLFGAYRVLRKLNPSPYMYYFSGGDVEIAGASPETLTRLSDGVCVTYPLAGSRPRGKTAEEDAALEVDLLADEKERAEHNMLVDLGRNDIGKISEFGSVCVSEYMRVLRFSHVMHIGSAVTGKARAGVTGLDAIAAVLPAGTLSGAPKIRACEIINALEGAKRGLYGGALGYLSLSGDMDVCIAIRTAFMKNGKLFVRSGCGVVADSVAETEYAECANKAAAVLKAIEQAASEEGSDTP